MRNVRRCLTYTLTAIPLLAVAAVCVFPLVYLAANSFMAADEIAHYYGTSGQAAFHLIPDRISLAGYYGVLLEQPDYLLKFWNSLRIALAVVVGQMIVSCGAGYAFAKFRFPGRDVLFFVYVVFMMLPFIVTLVPNEIVLRRLGLLDTTAALILPGIFAPFGAFLMRQVVSHIPNDVLDAARLDGTGQVRTLTSVVLPQCRGGLASVAILTFIDAWNMVEQPLVFLKSAEKFPLSVFLSRISYERMDLAFVCGILVVIPVLLLYFFFRDELIEGISYMGLQ